MKVFFTLCFLLVLNISSNAQSKCLLGNCNNGMGTYLWDSGAEYTGEWDNGDRTGLGVYDWADGSYYYGYFEKGKLEGKGFYIGKEKKDDLVGYFKNGEFSYKAYFDTVGCILGNCKDGVGVYLWSSGDMYLGEWVDGNRTGYGRYDWKGGASYVGSFKGGKLDGQGDYVGEDGKKMKGEFKNGEFQGTATNSTKSDAAASNNNSSTSNYIAEKDFCTVLTTVIGDFKFNLEGMKGKAGSYDDWDSNIKVTGSTDAAVFSGIVDDYNYWDDVLYTSDSWNSCYTKYNDFIDKLNSCDITCCNMTSDETRKNDEKDKNYKTTWKTKSLKDSGVKSVYKDMIIELECKTSYTYGYEVILTVSHSY